ncbi:MAG: geranylgeranyl reductase family protein, partial [Dehalococcoidia bacterium]|nr:geranylgeranyl reductase family protein [Dehalococcoidia bacterium]
MVGGGPAGAVAAHRVSAGGARVILLEKERLPRYKTCGGGVQARVARYLGLDLSAVARAQVDRMVFTCNLASPIEKTARAPVVWMVMRDDFDHFLLQRAAQAGVDVRDRQRVDHIAFDADGATVVTATGTIRAHVVIGADGANSRVAHAAGLAGGNDAYLALEGEFPASRTLAARWRNRALIDLGALPGGYGWLFPKGDTLSVGVGGPLPHRALFRPYFDRLVAYVGLDGVAPQRFSGHHLPLRKPGAAIVTDRVALVGDAAGLVDHFTGEGIWGAVVSGSLVAEPTLRRLGGDRAALAEYAAAVERELMPEMNESRVIVRVYERIPRLTHRLVGVSDLIWRNLERLMLGERTYQTMSRGAARLAWRAADRAL